MPTISDLEYGFDSAGVEQYLENIKAIVLTEAQEKLDDIAEIKAACENHWEGKARDQFLEKLETDKNIVSSIFANLYRALEGEINQTRAEMAKKDRSLIDYI